MKDFQVSHLTDMCFNSKAELRKAEAELKSAQEEIELLKSSASENASPFPPPLLLEIILLSCLFIF